MAQPGKPGERQWISAGLAGLVGAAFLVAGLVTDGTNRVDAIVIGVVALLVAAAIFSRRGPKKGEPELPPRNGPE
jgi:hypothetical protein